MITRLVALSSLMLPAACGAVNEREFPACWESKSFNDGERVTGQVTLLIDDQANWTMDGPHMFVSPLTCENGSFLVENPPLELSNLRKSWSDNRPLFGSAYEAEISGIVRLVEQQDHSGVATSPYSIEISKVAKLKSIPHPRWWKP